jgi:hypothetical protein
MVICDLCESSEVVYPIRITWGGRETVYDLCKFCFSRFDSAWDKFLEGDPDGLDEPVDKPAILVSDVTKAES